MMTGSALATIAPGLIYWLFDLDTPSAQWIGLQFFAGAVFAPLAYTISPWHKHM